MGLAANAALAKGGRVTGIIPARLRDAELAHPGVSELVVVNTMHARKALMAERANAFAILPGGIGTLDETFEILSWKQLGLHDKPIYLVDVESYWAASAPPDRAHCRQRLCPAEDARFAAALCRPSRRYSERSSKSRLRLSAPRRTVCEERGRRNSTATGLREQNNRIRSVDIHDSGG